MHLLLLRWLFLVVILLLLLIILPSEMFFLLSLPVICWGVDPCFFGFFWLPVFSCFGILALFWFLIPLWLLSYLVVIGCWWYLIVVVALVFNERFCSNIFFFLLGFFIFSPYWACIYCVIQVLTVYAVVWYVFILNFKLLSIAIHVLILVKSQPNMARSCFCEINLDFDFCNTSSSFLEWC